MTLAMIAKKAGVSITTASKVFNNDPTVRSYLRERVLEVADEHNYRPNVLARGLRNNYANLVSVGIQDIDNPFFGRMAEMISRGLMEESFGAIMCHNIDRVNEINQTARAAGTILVSPAGWHIQEVVQERALVTISARKPQLELAPNVTIRFEKAYQQLIARLLEESRSQFAYFCARHDWEVEREAKYQFVDQALADFGRSALNPPEGSYEMVEDIAGKLKGDPDSLDVVVCNNDLQANTLAHALWEVGINPTTDVLVVGCDGTVPRPGAWTIKVDIDAIATAAVDLLLTGLRGDKHPAETVIEPELIIPQ